jgi:hypothetical protein
MSEQFTVAVSAHFEKRNAGFRYVMIVRRSRVLDILTDPPTGQHFTQPKVFYLPCVALNVMCDNVDFIVLYGRGIAKAKFLGWCV